MTLFAGEGFAQFFGGAFVLIHTGYFDGVRDIASAPSVMPGKFKSVGIRHGCEFVVSGGQCGADFFEVVDSFLQLGDVTGCALVGLQNLFRGVMAVRVRVVNVKRGFIFAVVRKDDFEFFGCGDHG